jgi:hypothetical protein
LMGWELALLLPPVPRFFVGILLVVVLLGLETLFVYWISTLYGKDE